MGTFWGRVGNVVSWGSDSTLWTCSLCYLPNQNLLFRFSSNNWINLFMASDHLGCYLIRNTGHLFSNLSLGSLLSSDVVFGVIRLRYCFGYLFFLKKSTLSQIVTYYLWWVLWYFKEFKNAKLDKWQKMLLSLRSNPQTGSLYYRIVMICPSTQTIICYYLLFYIW